MLKHQQDSSPTTLWLGNVNDGLVGEN